MARRPRKQALTAASVRKPSGFVLKTPTARGARKPRSTRLSQTQRTTRSRSGDHFDKVLNSLRRDLREEPLNPTQSGRVWVSARTVRRNGKDVRVKGYWRKR